MIYRTNTFLYSITALISILVILSALYIEHVLSTPACKLCLYQRVPYLIAVIISFFGFFFPKNKIWTYLLILIFLIGITISGYHVGIENNIFVEFSGCSVENIDLINKSELLKSLNNNLPNCKDVTFRLFGLSLATINFIISIALAILAINYITNEKNR